MNLGRVGREINGESGSWQVPGKAGEIVNVCKRLDGDEFSKL